MNVQELKCEALRLIRNGRTCGFYPSCVVDKYLSRCDFQVLSTVQYLFKVSATDPN